MCLTGSLKFRPLGLNRVVLFLLWRSTIYYMVLGRSPNHINLFSDILTITIVIQLYQSCKNSSVYLSVLQSSLCIPPTELLHLLFEFLMIETCVGMGSCPHNNGPHRQLIVEFRRCRTKVETRCKRATSLVSIYTYLLSQHDT